MSPAWPDPSVALPQFRKAMSQFPSREQSQSEEFSAIDKAVRERMRLEDEERKANASKRQREAGLRLAERKRVVVVADMLARGESHLDRTRRQARESYARRQAKLKRLAESRENRSAQQDFESRGAGRRARPRVLEAA